MGLPANLSNLSTLPAPAINPDDFEDAVQSYFPRVSICQGMSQARKLKVAEEGDFVLTKAGKNITNLGNEIFITPVDMAWLAIDMNNLTFAYDRNSAQFKDIETRSTRSNSKCAWGPRFLVWCQGVGFVSLFCNSKTLRNDSAFIKMGMRTEDSLFTLRLTSRHIQNNDYDWYGLIVEGVDPMLPLDPTLPQDVQVYSDAIHKFRNEGTPEETAQAEPERG